MTHVLSFYSRSAISQESLSMEMPLVSLCMQKIVKKTRTQKRKRVLQSDGTF
jgi:hypothetical protein